MRLGRCTLTASFLLLLVSGCGDDGSTSGAGATGGGDGTGGSGVALQILVPTVPEVDEHCAGAFDTSAPPVGDPATFTVDGDRAIVRGTLGPTTPERLQAALDANPNLRTLVLANVPGTVDSVESNEAARMARKANLATCVPDTGYIASGAVDLFWAGAIRKVDRNYRGVVVHGWITEQCLPSGECPASLGEEGCVVGADLSMDDPQHDPSLDYYADVGVDESWYWWIFEQAPVFCDPLFMTPADLGTWRLETNNACTEPRAGAICNVPPGRFTETCRSCFFDEPTLSCECEGGAGTSSIDITTCSGGPIDNCGGELACGECDQAPLDLFGIEWDASVDLQLLVTDPLGRTIQPGGVNETANCSASRDATGGPGSAESIGCENPIEGVYRVEVRQSPAGSAEEFTFTSSKPAAGPVSAPYSVADRKDVYALVSDTLELELTWEIHHNLELILVDEDTRRAVAPRGTAFDPLPNCTTSADNTGSDVFESPHRETISCTGLDPGNYQVEVQNPGGGPVFEVGYTATIGDGGGSSVGIMDAAVANTRDEHELIVLGLTGVIDGAECTIDDPCDQPTDPCRVAICDASNACIERDSDPGTPCNLGGGALGFCQDGTCLP
jgi:hypothetical protein